MVENGKAVAHRFSESCVRSGSEAEPYWRDVGTIDAFWEANIDLTDFVPSLDLYDVEWPIWTYAEITPPAKFIHDEDGRRGMATSSLVSGGCIISGSKIDKSLLFTGVCAHSYGELTHAVVLPYVTIGRHAPAEPGRRRPRRRHSRRARRRRGSGGGCAAFPAHRRRCLPHHAADDRPALRLTDDERSDGRLGVRSAGEDGGPRRRRRRAPARSVLARMRRARAAVPNYPAVARGAAKPRRVAAMRRSLRRTRRDPRAARPTAASTSSPSTRRISTTGRATPISDPTGADWPDNHLRFAALRRAAALIASDSPDGWKPDCVHAPRLAGGAGAGLFAGGDAAAAAESSSRSTTSPSPACSRRACGPRSACRCGLHPGGIRVSTVRSRS